MSERWRFNEAPEGAGLTVRQAAQTSVLTIVAPQPTGLGTRSLRSLELRHGAASVRWRGLLGPRQRTLSAARVRAVEGRQRHLGDRIVYELSIHSGPGRRLRFRLEADARIGGWLRDELERWALIG